MQKKDFSRVNIPDTPGVYIFRGPRRVVLYVGKATSLKNRVRSYFGGGVAETRGGRIEGMVEQAKSVTWEETDSVLEALILEANLIKKYQPPFNVRDKDNKSFNYLVITKEEFSRILVVRGRELMSGWKDKNIKHLFGPFPEGGSLKTALKIVRKIFPFRDTCTPSVQGLPLYKGKNTRVALVPLVPNTTAGKACFNRQIGLCPGVCTGEISEEAYQKTVRNIALLFSGKKKALIAKLEKEMKTAARKENFEGAARLRSQVYALGHIRDVALIGDTFRIATGGAKKVKMRIEGYDVAHISGTSTTGVMTVVTDGEIDKKEYRTFNIRDVGNNDTQALKQLMERRLTHPEWQLPKIIVVDGGKAQIRAARGVLERAGSTISVVGVVKDERHKPRQILGDKKIISKHESDILLANSEAHRFALARHRKRRSKLS